MTDIPIAPHSNVPRERDDRPVRVLVVDDSRTFGRFLLRSLSVLGCEARLATNEQEMIEAVDAQAPDLVLLDWNLGGVAAAGLLEWLRARGLHAVVLTGDPENVGDIGIPVLGKPLHVERLRTLIHEAGTRP